MKDWDFRKITITEEIGFYDLLGIAHRIEDGKAVAFLEKALYKWGIPDLMMEYLIRRLGESWRRTPLTAEAVLGIIDDDGFQSDFKRCFGLKDGEEKR